MKHTMFAIAVLCGAGIVRAGNGNQIDPTAQAAVQYHLQIPFGTNGQHGISCPNPSTGGLAGLCLSVGTFNIPTGNRLVITNISGSYSFNANGGTDVISESVSIGLNVGGQIFFSSIPVDHIQIVGASTSYTFNKSVHMFADASVGFPEILIDNLGPGSVGPTFLSGFGFMAVTVQGYLVPLN